MEARSGFRRPGGHDGGCRPKGAKTENRLMRRFWRDYLEINRRPSYAAASAGSIFTQLKHRPRFLLSAVGAPAISDPWVVWETWKFSSSAPFLPRTRLGSRALKISGWPDHCFASRRLSSLLLACRRRELRMAGAMILTMQHLISQ